MLVLQSTRLSLNRLVLDIFNITLMISFSRLNIVNCLSGGAKSCQSSRSCSSGKSVTFSSHVFFVDFEFSFMLLKQQQAITCKDAINISPPLVSFLFCVTEVEIQFHGLRVLLEPHSFTLLSKALSPF